MASSRQFSGESLITNSNLPACQRACGKSFGQLHKHYVQASHSRLTGAAAQPCDAQRQQQQRFVLPQRSPAEHRQPPRREAASAAAAAAAAADCGGNGGSGGAAQPRKRTGGGDAGDNRGNSSRPCAPLQLLLALALVLPPAAPLLWPAAASASAVAASKKGKGQREVETSLPAWEVDAFVESLSELTGPLLNNMGFSGLLGAASAAALKVRGLRACARRLLRCEWQGAGAASRAAPPAAPPTRCAAPAARPAARRARSLWGARSRPRWAWAWCWCKCCRTTTW
jgi:hypothetical protein